MIKRPLNSRFNGAVHALRKITTIREKSWPVGKPVMIYNWSGKAYHSPQSDVTAVMVLESQPITITKQADGIMTYTHAMHLPSKLWHCEGFQSQEDMDAWFSAKMKSGQTIIKTIIKFQKIERGLATAPPTPIAE